jgi:nicotinate-nucleotide pyrophosphorylase (carboxylating)
MEHSEFLKELIQIAKREDVGSGDHSSLACFMDDTQGEAHMFAKEDGVLAGVEVAKQVFYAYDPEIQFEALLKDGDRILVGSEICHIKGNKRNILTAERTALNFMQRMSGIATKTREYVDLLEGTNVKVLDTRKTTPGLRFIEKAAVKFGGGTNHRFGLYDMIMLKDNHIDFSGGIKNAIKMANDYLKKNNLNIPIEIEVRDFSELKQVLETGNVDRIMLDNFTIEDSATAVELVNKRFELESSGGITMDTILQYAKTGVDFISVGALTHHIKSLDISLCVL